MANDERTKEILNGLGTAVFTFQEEDVVKWSRAALAEGVDPYTATVEGLASGMLKAGEAHNNKEYYVPELLMCADALNAGLAILRPAVEASGRKARVQGSIVLGVVEGDVHDIGKNLVKLMFEVAGWTVHDLGSDVPLDRFAQEQAHTGAPIVGISALMTTSMTAIPEVIKRLRAASPSVKILVGGAPLNPQTAEAFGADGFARTAGMAVDEAIRLLGPS